jgi:hypothetical protein
MIQEQYRFSETPDGLPRPNGRGRMLSEVQIIQYLIRDWRRWCSTGVFSRFQEVNRWKDKQILLR